MSGEYKAVTEALRLAAKETEHLRQAMSPIERRIWSIEVYDAATDGHITDLVLTPEQVRLLRPYLDAPVSDDDLIGVLHPVGGVVLFLGVRRDG